MHAASSTNIFAPISTPAQSIFDLSLFVLLVTAAVFVVVFSLLVYAVVKFRKRSSADDREPAQVYGSTQLEMAWTVIPILIVVVLFLATARVIARHPERSRASQCCRSDGSWTPVLVGVSISVTARGDRE